MSHVSHNHYLTLREKEKTQTQIPLNEVATSHYGNNQTYKDNTALPSRSHMLQSYPSKPLNFFATNQHHSTIVDSTLSDQDLQVKTFGNFQSYPNGIFNPSFCGMMLWEIDQGSILNKYKIS